MASVTVCGATVTRRTANILAAVGSVGILASCLIIIPGFAIGCQTYRYINGNIIRYKTDCTTSSILVITGIVLLSVAVPVAICGCIMLYRIRRARVPMAMPVTMGAPMHYGQPHLQQGVGQPYLQQGEGQLYPQQGTHQPYPQQAAAPPYPQQAAAPPYPQQAAAPPYPQQAAASPYPQQTPGLPHDQGPDQRYPQKSAYLEPTQLRLH
ncbi:AT-rich interactive domain-containing protein 1A-like [Penaeus monodon]|uniref:AT-rich interactive domain-containing protein 1A-like n=1 Tax=Penaeus monodon TaxID=6687 RepID=UPI0018A79E8B|nr:AT-rich interactive domain-containing protein 1A-like [Penaeus monodon]